MKTVQEFWQSYQQDVVPETADAVQIEETQKAFYAGCFAFVALVRANPEVETFNRLEAELESFISLMGSKHATTH